MSPSLSEWHAVESNRLRGAEFSTDIPVRPSVASVRETLGPQLGEGPLRFAELEAHAVEHALGLRELDLVVLHDLDAVSARVAEVEPRAREDLDSGFLERTPRVLLVVDDEPVMRLLGARSALEQGDELSPSSRNAAPGSLRSMAVGLKRSV
jgi:hypothetical protein